MEACEELRQVVTAPPNSFPASTGKYGFVNKVIDGITATVNSVEIIFQSKEFESKVQVGIILGNNFNKLLCTHFLYILCSLL